MRVIQESAIGSHPQWERLLEHGTTTDSESSCLVDHLSLAVNSAQQTSFALVPTVWRQGWSISSTASNARNPLSEAASKLILNASFASVEDGNFLKALFASRVYARVSRKSTSSGDSMTISEFNLSGRALFSYRLERRRVSLPPVALLSSSGSVFNKKKQVETFHKYIDLGSIDITRALLEYGMDIKAKNSNGQAPLYVAMAPKRGMRAVQNMDMIKLLLEYGADVNEPNLNCGGKRALHNAIAATTNSVAGTSDAIVRLLLAHGAEINAADSSGWRLLHIAVDNGHTEIVKLLLEWGAQTEASDRDGWWPLHIAANKGHTEVVKLLLERGAQIEASNEYGKRALHLAANEGHTEVVKLLLERGAQIEASDEHSERALHLAARSSDILQHSYKPVLKILLKHGADTEAEDAEGKKPRDYADDGEIRIILGGV